MQLLHGDCLELMKGIPDKSVDMILCDLPYGTTACKWDTIIPFEPLWEQYNRVIKDNTYGKFMNGAEYRNDNNGFRYPKQIIEFGVVERGTVHPTQKPIALLEYLIRTYTNDGETVLDNCMGSGSTGVACVQTGRDFIGIELDDNYFEIAQKRIYEAQEALDGKA